MKPSQDFDFNTLSIVSGATVSMESLTVSMPGGPKTKRRVIPDEEDLPEADLDLTQEGLEQ